jgi:hypothetical protein
LRSRWHRRLLFVKRCTSGALARAVGALPLYFPSALAFATPSRWRSSISSHGRLEIRAGLHRHRHPEDKSVDVEIVLLDAKGVSLKVLEQAIDTSTSTGRLMFNMLGAIAQFECGVGPLTRRWRGWPDRLSAPQRGQLAPPARRRACGRLGSIFLRQFRDLPIEPTKGARQGGITWRLLAKLHDDRPSLL